VLFFLHALSTAFTPTPITCRWVRGLAYVFVGLFALESSREYVVYGAAGADSTGGASSSSSSSGTPATNANGTSSSTGSGMLDSIAALSVLHVCVSACVCICANIVSKIIGNRDSLPCDRTAFWTLDGPLRVFAYFLVHPLPRFLCSIFHASCPNIYANRWCNTRALCSWAQGFCTSCSAFAGAKRSKTYRCSIPMHVLQGDDVGSFCRFSSALFFFTNVTAIC